MWEEAEISGFYPKDFYGLITLSSRGREMKYDVSWEKEKRDIRVT